MAPSSGGRSPGWKASKRRHNSAAAAMKEAMEYAEARLRAAKELMKRKGDSFKIRKKPSHHRSTRSVEIKAPVEVYTFEENLSVKKPTNEENNSENFVLDKHQQVSAVGSNHHDDSGKMVLPLKKPQQMTRTRTMPCQTSSTLEKLGNWRSGDEFFELTGDDQKCHTGTVRGKEDNCGRSRPVTEPSEGQKAKTEVTAQGSDLERYEKPWYVSDGSDLGVKEENQKEVSTVPWRKGRIGCVQFWKLLQELITLSWRDLRLLEILKEAMMMGVLSFLV